MSARGDRYAAVPADPAIRPGFALDFRPRGGMIGPNLAAGTRTECSP